MAEDHKKEKDGILGDGASHYPANAHDMQLYEDAKQSLKQFKAPVLLDKGNPHQRLYVAAFDSTGMDNLTVPDLRPSFGLLP